MLSNLFKFKDINKIDFDDLKMSEDVIQVNKILQIVSLKLFWISQPSRKIIKPKLI